MKLVNNFMDLLKSIQKFVETFDKREFSIFQYLFQAVLGS